MKRILFVSHCLMNTAAKVINPFSENRTSEDTLRKEFLYRAIDQDIQIIQLPCPEFTAYGASRWGHTKEQFDNPFFRDHCRELLEPIVQQMRAYLQPQESEKFNVLGIVGINGSPSCGVEVTCSGSWGGDFSKSTDLEKILSGLTYIPQKGVLMEVLSEMLQEEGIELKMVGLDTRNPKNVFELLEESE